MRLGSTSSTSASSGSRSVSRCSRSVSHGNHDSMPSNTLALGQALPLLATPRLLRDERRGALAHVVGGEQLAGREDARLGDVVGRALVGDRERGEAVDLVAPEVDAHGVVVGRRVHVDDRAPHRDLAARLDLVLAPVAHRRRAAPRARRGRPGRPAAPRPARPLRRADRGAAPARAPARPRPAAVPLPDPEPPHHAEASAHRLERRRHPLERQGLPRREELDLAVAEELARGRAPGARPRRPSAPPAAAVGAW